MKTTVLNGLGDIQGKNGHPIWNIQVPRSLLSDFWLGLQIRPPCTMQPEIQGFARGCFFEQVFPGSPKPERGYKKRNDGTKKPERGYKKKERRYQKSRNEGTFAKTALLQNQPFVSSREMITQIIRKQLFCVTDVCVCMCVTLGIHFQTEKSFIGARLTQKNCCQKARGNRNPVLLRN